MNDMKIHEKLIKRTQEFEQKFKKAKEDPEKIKISKEFVRLYFNKYVRYKKWLFNINIWENVKKRIRKTDNLFKKLEIIENFINTSYICTNNECKIFSPIEGLNKALSFMKFTSLKKAKKKYGKNSVKFKNFQKKYDFHLLTILEIQRMAFQMISVKNGQRFETEQEQQRYERSVLAADDARKKGKVYIHNIGDLESHPQKQAKKLGYKSAKKETEKGEVKTKEEEREIYQEEGKYNIDRLEGEFGKDLEKIKRKSKKKEESESES